MSKVIDLKLSGSITPAEEFRVSTSGCIRIRQEQAWRDVNREVGKLLGNPNEKIQEIGEKISEYLDTYPPFNL